MSMFQNNDTDPILLPRLRIVVLVIRHYLCISVMMNTGCNFESIEGRLFRSLSLSSRAWFCLVSLRREVDCVAGVVVCMGTS